MVIIMIILVFLHRVSSYMKGTMPNINTSPILSLLIYIRPCKKGIIIPILKVRKAAAQYNYVGSIRSPTNKKLPAGLKGRDS